MLGFKEFLLEFIKAKKLDSSAPLTEAVKFNHEFFNITDEQIKALLNSLIKPGLKYGENVVKTTKRKLAVKIQVFNNRAERINPSPDKPKEFMNTIGNKMLNWESYDTIIRNFLENLSNETVSFTLTSIENQLYTEPNTPAHTGILSNINYKLTFNNNPSMGDTDKSLILLFLTGSLNTNASLTTNYQESVMAGLVEIRSEISTSIDFDARTNTIRFTGSNSSELGKKYESINKMLLELDSSKWPIESMCNQVECLFETLDLRGQYICKRRSELPKLVSLLNKVKPAVEVDSATPADIVAYRKDFNWSFLTNNAGIPNIQLAELTYHELCGNILLISLKQSIANPRLEVLNASSALDNFKIFYSELEKVYGNTFENNISSEIKRFIETSYKMPEELESKFDIKVIPAITGTNILIKFIDKNNDFDTATWKLLPFDTRKPSAPIMGELEYTVNGKNIRAGRTNSVIKALDKSNLYNSIIDIFNKTESFEDAFNEAKKTIKELLTGATLSSIAKVHYNNILTSLTDVPNVNVQATIKGLLGFMAVLISNNLPITEVIPLARRENSDKIKISPAILTFKLS